MTRSTKKGPYVDYRLAKKVQKMLADGKKTIIKTYSRACMIAPEFVGFTFAVHNGKEFKSVLISEDHVGHRLGEFSPTRKFRGHGGKDR